MLQKKPTEAFTFFLNVFKLCQNYRIYELIYDTYGNFLVTEHNIFIEYILFQSMNAHYFIITIYFIKLISRNFPERQ